MRARSKAFFVLVLVVGLSGWVFRSEDPMVTVTSTSLPWGSIRYYLVTPKHLRITTDERLMFGMRLNQKLASMLPEAFTRDRVVFKKRLNSESARHIQNAIRNVPLESLKSRYSDPYTDDGFVLKFQFHQSGKARQIELENWYVPELYAILDECNKHLPPKMKLYQKEQFVRSNRIIDEMIAKISVNERWSPEMREQAIAQLRERKVDLVGNRGPE